MHIEDNKDIEAGENKSGQRKRKKGNIVSNIILVLAIAVFLYSGYQLFTIFSEYNKGENEYEDIVDEVIVLEKEEEGEESEEDSEKKEAEIFKVDFQKLLEINPEVVAWIRFDEPSKISYPVVQGPDNSKYLTKTFEGKRNSAGALFVDANNTGDFSDRNTFIYGHNMKNGSMFGQLRKYKEESFGKEHPYFYLYTPDGKTMKYQVFAVSIVEDTAESYNKFYSDDEDFLKYIEHIRSISRYDIDVEVTGESQIVSLSTCTNVSETQRLLVHGVKISESVAESTTGE